eukprot:TRINITY_DN8019_c0_g1_i1.p1 TRINITY_DN8019_c0_g1~~TRINITY_DN8019_c0_g1_i1.p1  ORF type:complete len:477 (-),score=94.01 TRINITY_DN8019_c0_g1_i1:92-1522(-)
MNSLENGQGKDVVIHTINPALLATPLNNMAFNANNDNANNNGQGRQAMTKTPFGSTAQKSEKPYPLSVIYGAQTSNKIESVERNKKMNLMLSCSPEVQRMLAHARIEIAPDIIADTSDWTTRSKKLLPPYNLPPPTIRGPRYRLEICVQSSKGERVESCLSCLKDKQNQNRSFVRVRCPFVDARKNGSIRLPCKFPCLPSHQSGGVPKMLFAEFKLVLLSPDKEELQFYSCSQLQFRKHTGGSNSSSSTNSREAPENSYETFDTKSVKVLPVGVQDSDTVMELSSSPPQISPMTTSVLMDQISENSCEESDCLSFAGGMPLQDNRPNTDQRFGWNLLQELTMEALKRENTELKSKLTAKDDELTSTKKSLALLEIEHSHIQEKLERKENELQYQMRILEEMEKRMKQMVLTLANGGDEPRRGGVSPKRPYMDHIIDIDAERRRLKHTSNPPAQPQSNLDFKHSLDPESPFFGTFFQ